MRHLIADFFGVTHRRRVVGYLAVLAVGAAVWAISLFGLYQSLVRHLADGVAARNTQAALTEIGGLMLLSMTAFLLPLALIVSAFVRKLIASRNEVSRLNLSLEKRVEEETEKRIEQERMVLQQSRLAAMGEMIGAIAHQWRQPINSLNLIVYNIKEAYDEGALSREFFDAQFGKVNYLVQKMSGTIDEFRDFFKPDKQPSPFMVTHAAEDALRLLGESLKNSGIAYELKAGSISTADGFKNEFAQVVVNLLQNAKDAILAYRETGGRIDLEVFQEGRWVVLKVRDNGGGIRDKAVLSRIFEPLFTTKEGSQGTGIGLYLSKKIIETHMKGSITARTLGSGEGMEYGMEFIIKIPTTRGEE